MRFYTKYFKSVTKDDIYGHPDLSIVKIEVGEFLLDKYDNLCLPYFDNAGNLDSIQHQDNYNWFTLHSLIVDLGAKILLPASIDELCEDEDKFDEILKRDTRFVIDHCEDVNWDEYHNLITEFNGISSKELEKLNFEDKEWPNWNKYFKSDVGKRLYSFDDTDFVAVCYKTLKSESMENLVYTYLGDEMNKFSLIGNEDEACYIDNEDELGCGEIHDGLYLINDSAKQTIMFQYEYNRQSNQFQILYFKIWDRDDNYTKITHAYDSFFDLTNNGILEGIVKIWLSPSVYFDSVLDELKNNERVFIGNDLPF
jgi:hypothetical protein